MMLKEKGILIITKPIGKAGAIPLNNLYNIFKKLFGDVYLITGDVGYNRICETHPADNFRITSINQEESNNLLIKILRHIRLQIDISTQIVKHSNKTEHIFFFLDSHALIFPVIVSKLLRKRVFFIISAWLYGSHRDDPDFFYKFLILSEKITFKLADNIILYSAKLIETWDLHKYEKKILIARPHTIDPANFESISSFESRKPIIAFIGRLADGKGVREFLSIAQKVNGLHPDLTFWVIGDGPLAPLVLAFQRDNASDIKMEFFGWVNNSELPGLLNQIKIAILLSQSEGLPNVLLEAMACGVVVMATPVGAIPDILQNRQNGFLIAKDNLSGAVDIITEVLQNREFAKDISKQAEEFIKTNYNFETVSQKYRQSLESAENGRH